MANTDAPAHYNFTTEKDLEALEAIAATYPYFSLAHLHRLAHMPVYYSEQSEIAAKAALHMPDSLLLQQRVGIIKGEEVEHAHGQQNSNGFVFSQETLEEASSNIDAVDTAAPVVTEESGAPLAEIDNEKEVREEANIPVAEEEIKPAEAIQETEGQKLKDILSSPTSVADQAGSLLFEPLHTSDYFASQGIKITEIIEPQDKLGKQLKSFTEWLHVMKKIKVDLSEEGNETTDKVIINLAEKSNEGESVVTEAMAEAYLFQGKVKKAIKTYKKLSLLNTDKSSYFAAKIGELES